MIEKISKRVKKTIINQIEKLIRKYGMEEVRCVINKFFQQVRDEANLQKEVIDKEKELEKLRRKLGR